MRVKNDPNIVFSFVLMVTWRDLLRCVRSKCSRTGHTQRWSERKDDPMLCNGNLAFFCICPATYSRNSTKCGRLGNSRICGRPRCDRRRPSPDSMCPGMFSQVQKKIKLNGTIMKRLMKFWQTKDVLDEADREADWPLRVRERASSILASSSSPCSRCYQANTSKHATSTERSPYCRCYVLLEIVDSVGMHFSILNAVCMGTTCDQAWILRESETLGSPSSHACLQAFVHGWTRWPGWPTPAMAGHVGLVGYALPLLPRNTQQRHLQFDSCKERRDQTCLDWMRPNRSEELNDELTCSRI